MLLIGGKFEIWSSAFTTVLTYLRTGIIGTRTGIFPSNYVEMKK